MKIDWKRKLSSRKLWLAVAAFVNGVVLLFSGHGTIEGVILALGSVVAYIVAEGLTDAAAIKSESASTSTTGNVEE